ncbi:hypothetical protein F5Y18DRAFT_196743 [Xylariaceae sp. FL1019]|nr:hypothetical protein F5Y18DRAFT_196743 [Xylariaceae sp. FL1019]
MLDKIPEELLVEILVLVLKGDSPLVIDYVPRVKTRQQRQTRHIKDWVFVNSVCRRIRRAGRPLFFQTKTIVMTDILPQSLSKRRLSHLPGFVRILKSSEDLLLHMRDLVLVSARTMVFRRRSADYWKYDLPRPSADYWKYDLPDVLAYMPTLQKCTLCLTWHGSRREGLEKMAAAVASREPVEDGLRSRLLAVGVPARIELLQTTGMGISLNYLRHHIHTRIFPFLEAKARALQEEQAALGVAPSI